MAEKDDIREDPTEELEEVLDPSDALLAWVMARVTPWRSFRDMKHKDKWDEYARIWRGDDGEESSKAPNPKRNSERSKVITPATMQAVDSTVAEIEEAVFGREVWFDVYEDIKEQADFEQRQEMIEARDLLLELTEQEGYEAELGKTFVCGAVYGTGIGKINVYPKKIEYYDENGDVKTREEARVEYLNVEPYQFIPDPTTDNLDRMLGMAHETIAPLSEVREAIRSGRYRNVDIGTWSPDGQDPLNQENRLFTYEGAPAEGVKITEWHGKVPAKYLMSANEESDPLMNELLEDTDEDEIMVEAIVTIGNEGVVLAARANPYDRGQRCFVAYQHDTVPGYFWGRGVVEKAYHAQKTLDAHVRMRIDSLALVANPMVAGDITRLPRGMNLGVWPGKFWPTTGQPGDVIQPFQFGAMSPQLFDAAADMERMVQTATGAMDPGASYGAAQGSQDRAMMSASFLKRARRTMQNIERSLLRPLIRKTMWRYVQYLPTVFPQDYEFTVRGTLGVMAREIEQQQIVQMASLVPNESRPFLAIVKAFFDNSSNSKKKEINSALEELLNPEPNPEAEKMQQRMQELEMRRAEAEVAEVEAKAQKALAEAERAKALAQAALVEADFKDEELANQQIQHAIDLKEVNAFEMQNQISQMMQHLRAFDLALKAKETEARIGKMNAEAQAIQRGVPKSSK